MAWRFKASKYKNAAPIVPKPEACIRDVCVGSYQTFGNNICASAAFMAFNWEHVGSSMAVLPLDDCGRKSKTMPLLHAHSDTITDMEFSPFHDGLLLTGSQDYLVKLWHIPPEGLKESLTTPECVLSQKQRRVENVGFHPVADGLIHVASGHDLALWDLTTQQEAFVNREHEEVIQSTSWKKDGKLLVTSCKDKRVRILDPRVSSSIISVANSHQNIKDSRVVWLGDQNRILTTGFDAARLRQIIIRDVRNLSQTQKTLELDCSTGILMPLFDPDTNMLFLAGKGDTTIMYMEVIDREPYLIEGLRHSGEQTKGACLVPKRALRVMEGEVNRVLQLTSSTVIPIMYQVPRKSYREYHADLYPDTSGSVTYLSAPMWLANQDCAVPHISLHPDANNCTQVHRGNLDELVQIISKMPPLKKSEPNNEKRKDNTQKLHENMPSITPTIDNVDEDRIDFVKVKDLIKGMEKQAKPQKINKTKELNGFHNKIINDADSENKKKIDETEQEKIDLTTEKTDDDDVEYKQKNGFYSIDQNVNVSEKVGMAMPENKLNNYEMNGKQSENNGVCKEDCSIEMIIEENTTIAKEANDIIIKHEEADINKELVHTNTSTDSVEVYSSNDSVVNGSSHVPKPLPRSSISEPNGEEAVIEAPRPKPRTTNIPIISYKPRLGPKPFSATSNSEEFSFEKVFSVPAVPGITKVEMNSDKDLGASSVQPSTPLSSTPNSKNHTEVKDKSVSPTSDIDIAPNKEEYSNGKSDTSVDEELNSSDSGYRPKTPSTAERRKLFETTDPSGAQGIAERRRAYESRSISLVVDNSMPVSPAPLRRRDSLKYAKSPEQEDKRSSVPNATKRTSTVFGKVSKFRHLKGTPGHKSTHVENIKNISRQISGECNGFYANGVRCAVPMGGGGGRIAIIELPLGASPRAKAAPRSPPHTFALLHPAPLQDWTWDPFRDDRLMVACDDGLVREWIIPPGGLEESTNEPARTFAAHPDKIYIVRFHPTSSDILTTAAHDLTVKVWHLAPAEPELAMVLEGHTDQIFALDWSPCGGWLATVCRDGLIRVYKPRVSVQPVCKGQGPVGARGARIVWALNATHLVVTGFDRVSERQITLYKADDLSTPLCTVGLDVSPAILQPHLDHDSGTLFLTGRGDSTIYCYEVSDEPPYLCALSHHRASTLHQGIAFLQKNLVAVDKVEFARALRLTNGNIEPLSFTVPRIKSELFQDDLFPPTIVTWEPRLAGAAWLSGERAQPLTRSLQPPGMLPVSGQRTPPARDSPKPQHKAKLDSTVKGVTDPRQQRDDIMKALSAKVDIDLKLEQDTMEGVDEAEWDQ